MLSISASPADDLHAISRSIKRAPTPPLAGEGSSSSPFTFANPSNPGEQLITVGTVLSQSSLLTNHEKVDLHVQPMRNNHFSVDTLVYNPDNSFDVPGRC